MGLSALLNSLDLANIRRYTGFPTRRFQFGYVSRLLRKSSGSCDDAFVARNLWPCRDPDCPAVLGPLDVFGDKPKTVTEMYEEDMRCCSVCGTWRHKVEFSDFHRLFSLR